MSSRENILNAISTNKPLFTELPLLDLNEVTAYEDLPAQFRKALLNNGGQVFDLLDIQELETNIREEIKSGKIVLNMLNGTSVISENTNYHQAVVALETLDKVYLKSELGVAENGAVWIGESEINNRLLPFICQHLVIVLEKEKLVATMHQAYQRMNHRREGFGVFIAGPSKTADIEQSLVIGAHGARSMTVYLLP